MAVMDMEVAMMKTIMVMISMIVRMVMTITTNLTIGTSFASNPGADNEDDDDMMSEEDVGDDTNYEFMTIPDNCRRRGRRRQCKFFWPV